MATRKVTLSTSAWTLVTAVAFGTLENKTSAALMFRFDAALPAVGVLDGHNLEAGERYQWTLVVAQNLYARLNAGGQGFILISD